MPLPFIAAGGALSAIKSFVTSKLGLVLITAGILGSVIFYLKVSHWAEVSALERDLSRAQIQIAEEQARGLALKNSVTKQNAAVEQIGVDCTAKSERAESVAVRVILKKIETRDVKTADDLNSALGVLP